MPLLQVNANWAKAACCGCCRCYNIDNTSSNAYTYCDSNADLCLHQVDGKMGKGGLLLGLRMLRLADHQAAVRAKIEKEQEEIQGMSERNYRKFARNCLRQRIEIIKQVSWGSLPQCNALLDVTAAVNSANLLVMLHEA